MPIIPWIIAALSAIAAALLAVLWRRRVSLLSEELQRLRQTLNTWETQPAPVTAQSDQLLQKRLDALRDSSLQLAKQISSKSNFNEPEECVVFFREAITTLSRANRKSKDRLDELQSELEQARTRLKKVEHTLEETTDDPSTMDNQLQDVRALLAMTIAERDQLKYRVQELKSNMRKP